MRSHRSFLACLFLLDFASRAMAQPSPAPGQIETVIVIANANGPAVWHAAKGGADVAILGIVQPLPDNFVWNRKPLDRALSGARRVLLPPQIRMGVFSGAWFYLTENGLLHPPDGKTLWNVLEPRVAGDLAEACNFLHQPKDRYSGDSPMLAAMRLGSDFRHVAYLTTHEPEDTIAAAARARRITTRRIATYDLVPSAEDLLKLPPAVAGRCIEAEIHDIEFQSKHASAAANAWAVGNVDGMLANWAPSDYYQCLYRLSANATAMDVRAIGDTVNAISVALSNGGQTLAIVDIGLLLRKDGVLDRLKTEGATITLSPPR
ncbi:MAG TPA: TraB/GumN family protein [Rhizomicrobium sp.]|jgi:hypothetical protein|nr:TraB/GumN family protein [Rhizomicrobium sp.]